MRRDEITQEYVLSRLDYDSESGSLIWRARLREHFSSSRTYKMWNTRFAGVTAGWVAFQGPVGYAKPYVLVRLEGKNHFAHRLVWMRENGEWPENDIDHIDHDGLNNRLSNLRCITRKEQGLNLSLSSNNTSGVTGVSWRRDQGKWSAVVTFRKRRIYLGSFACIGRAIAARAAANERYGFHENHGKVKA